VHTIASQQHGSDLTIYIRQDIDHHNAANIRAEIDAEISRLRPRRVILNFESVDFMDSSGIGLIMGRYKNLQTAGANLSIEALNPRCQKLVDLSGITGYIG